MRVLGSAYIQMDIFLLSIEWVTHNDMSAFAIYNRQRLLMSPLHTFCPRCCGRCVRQSSSNGTPPLKLGLMSYESLPISKRDIHTTFLHWERNNNRETHPNSSLAPGGSYDAVRGVCCPGSASVVLNPFSSRCTSHRAHRNWAQMPFESLGHCIRWQRDGSSLALNLST